MLTSDDPHPTSKVNVLLVPITDLRLQQWRASPDLVRQAASVLSNDSMQMMIRVLENEHPGWEVLSPPVDVVARASQQAKAEGYTMALANLRALGQAVLQQETLSSVFEPEDQMT